MLLLDVRPLNLHGKEVEELLQTVDIFVNRNAIPGDTLSPLLGGGIRIGTAAITTRGATVQDCKTIAEIIDQMLQKKGDVQNMKKRIHEISKNLLIPA